MAQWPGYPFRCSCSCHSHGQRYTDHYPKGDPHGLDPKELVRKLVHEVGANLYFIKVDSLTDRMVALFRTACEPLDGREFKEFNLGSNAGKFLDTMVASIESSIAGSGFEEVL